MSFGKRSIVFILTGLMVLSLIGCGNDSTKKNITSTDIIVSAEANKPSTETKETLESDDDSYKIITEEAWYDNDCKATQIICPAFDVEKSVAENYTTIDWLKIFSENMKLTKVSGTKTEYSEEDLANCDETLLKTLLQDCKSPNGDIDFEFVYGEEKERIKITASVFYKEGNIYERWINALIGDEANFKIRDNDKYMENYPEAWANTLLYKTGFSESVTE